jgi:hypothetical protein
MYRLLTIELGDLQEPTGLPIETTPNQQIICPNTINFSHFLSYHSVGIFTPLFTLDTILLLFF